MKTASPVSRRAALLVAITLLFVRAVSADDISVMTSGAFTAPYLELLPQLERIISGKVVTAATSMGTGQDYIPNRLARGEPVDIVILADETLEELIKDGRVVANSRVPLARSSIGMAVRAGTPKPDISSVDALKRTLQHAKSVAYSASVSGTYISTELFQRLGIADEMRGKSRRIDRERVAAVVARGEAEIGFQQISELLPVPGIEYVGPLPPEVQRVTVFSAGVAARSKNADAARAVIRFLASPEAAGTVARSGLEPIATAAQDKPLPRVVLIGDSIRMGYAPLVAQRLEGKAVVISAKPNGEDSANVLRNLDEWVITERPDIVHINAGLHDLKVKDKTYQVPLSQYEKNLATILQRIRTETKATIIFATTTPILDNLHAQRKAGFDRFQADVERYNAAAVSVMTRAGVPVNDLHKVVEEGGKAKLMAGDGTHYTPQGYDVLATAVTARIVQALR